VLNFGWLIGTHNQTTDIEYERKVLSNSLRLPFIDLREVINISTDLGPDNIHINSLDKKMLNRFEIAY
jgi:hypothetical protein